MKQVLSIHSVKNLVEYEAREFRKQMIKPFPNQLSSLGQQESLDPPPRVSGKVPVEGVSDVLWNKGGKNLNQRRDIFRGD